MGLYREAVTQRSVMLETQPRKILLRAPNWIGDAVMSKVRFDAAAVEDAEKN